MFPPTEGTIQRKEDFEGDGALTKEGEHAYHTHKGVSFSRVSTHLGGSMVLYYPTPSSTTLVAGSIQRIITEDKGVFFYIRRQAPLPATAFDPFLRYTSYPARVFSSTMSDEPEDRVTPSSVRSHAARFNFSKGRAVILDLSRVSPQL